MWDNIQVDIWFYSLLFSSGISWLIFFLKRPLVQVLYITLPIDLFLWFKYEGAIAEHLSMSVPIRVDFPIVLVAALFPVFPIWVDCKWRHGQKGDESSNKSGGGDS